ncbi:MAG: hypothetical protein EHM36_15760 [Deltaproteobacteria bacterium]|nr:MAG: hypothetical protein EHM36_15760 [Deltaproteobacteria bacterium]
MVKVKCLLIAVLILAIGGVAAFYLFPSEEKKIKKQFALLSESVSKDSDESPLGMAQKLLKMGTLFSEKCEIKTHLESLSGVYSPQEISGYASRGRALFSNLRLRFFDLKIEFPEIETAKVVLAARLNGRLANGESVDESHELESTLRKIGKKWLFTSIVMVEVLKK